ncbi:MAG: PAS domain S-box protein, partial [Sporomusa sp.]
MCADDLRQLGVVTKLDSGKKLYKELEAIINSSYDGMFITDGDGVVLRLNKAYERITGLKASEIVGKNMKDLVTDGYYDESVTLLVIKKRETVTINQTVTKNRKILVTGTPIFDEQGNLFRIVTNVRDITELTSLQNQLVETKEKSLKYKTELSHLRAMQIQNNELITRSPKMARVIELSMKIADVDSTVLISGESGTGKELIAKLIHKHGKTTARP